MLMLRRSNVSTRGSWVKSSQHLTNPTVLQVVDRELEQINKELAIIGSSQNIEQLAKLGQTVGADFILVPSVDSFSYEQESRQVGNKRLSVVFSTSR